MSLIMPIMINNTTIGALTIHRTQRLRNNRKDDVHTYEWELFMKGGKTLRGERDAESYAGTVEHSYSAGAVELIKKVMAQIP
ncbi:hypothetical protein SSEA_SKINNY_90 [Mycobacterium phage Skinny]|uniref:Uncharacterized protein n=5 Tax=Bongovirus bongo TaxID=1983750 RepID=A0A0M5M579_9CAUD|nr:hypothetical protein FDH95_gp086 [Mycobacterium phage Bongo]ALF00613.1 hypothetical protein SEA_BRICOLE_85 [Mycobacterium phage Bricole]AXQ52726.1 hypothetical protein SEA_IPHANE7_85 [Mycobacterium phage IPhane7]QDH93660.1 hypothetical protein SEA_LILHOMIEP_86 [Mycobacterium phage LilhomieP]QGJ93231.1 hypothetical protein SEA_TYDAWG_86 [Mycobacterium phage TyDawg]UXE05334.1 hypothetical protein SSEA_SKINNY_90 [Mycobacterium phage Skinny]WNM75298.1 hypothetical protein SEA_AUSPICE_86 [Mycob